MLSEISRKQINLSKYEETNLLWHNSVLALRGNKNLHLIDFSYNLRSLEKIIDFKENAISASFESPVPNNFLSNYAAQGIKNLELMEMVTNPAFWPHHKLLTQEMTSITSFKWSPNNLINNHETVLATVNSVGNVEFFVQQKQSWISLMDFSKEMKKHLNSNFDMLNKCPKGFNELKTIVYNIETSAVTWARELIKDNSCYFATVQRSGEIFFWLLKYVNNTLQTEFCGSLRNSNEDEVILIHWIPIDNNKFLLLFSNECGQILANECELIEKRVTLLQEYSIWSHKDKMMVTYLDYIFEDDKLLLFFNKHRHLVVQMYDKTLKLVTQCLKNINDYRITCITKCTNEFYICTVNNKIYRVKYNIQNDAIEIILNLVEVKDSYPTCELFGLGFSKNKLLIAMALIDRKLLYRKESLKIDIIFLCNEIGLEENTLAILNNPSKKLTDMWDYIEVLRCKVIKAKKLPELDYNMLLNNGEFDVYKLKVYLIFLIFYHNLESLMTIGLKGRLPETSVNVIKDRILLAHCINVIKTIHGKYEISNDLSDFEKECFECSKKYLYYYCKLYSKNHKEFISENSLNLPNVKIEYTCQACDEKIIDFSCKNEHLNMFCSLTFTPIESDEYLVCKSCGTTARIESYVQNPMCVFCDLYLSRA